MRLVTLGPALTTKTGSSHNVGPDQTQAINLYRCVRLTGGVKVFRLCPVVLMDSLVALNKHVPEGHEKQHYPTLVLQAF